MRTNHSILGIDETASIEDVHKAFRMRTLDNNDDYDTLLTAYTQIMNKKPIEPAVDRQVVHSMGMSTPHMPFVTNPVFTNSTNSVAGTFPLDGLFQQFFGMQNMNDVKPILNMFAGPKPSKKDTDEMEEVMSEIFENIFHLKDLKQNSQFSDRSIPHTNSRNRDTTNNRETLHIEKSITYNDIYMYQYLGTFLKVDELSDVSLLDIKFNEKNEFVFKDNIYIIELALNKDEYFSILKNCLCYTAKITLSEALCGFSFTLRHLNGKEYCIQNNKSVIHPNSTIELKNMGFHNNQSIGPLIIKFDVSFPQYLDETVKKQLRDILSTSCTKNTDI
jgi:hypothetical protein